MEKDHGLNGIFINFYTKIWDGRFEMSVKDETQPSERFPSIWSAFTLMSIYRRKQNVLNEALPKPTSNRIAFSIKDVIAFYPAMPVFHVLFFISCRNHSTAVSPKMKVSTHRIFFFRNELNDALKMIQTQISISCLIWRKYWVILTLLCEFYVC